MNSKLVIDFDSNQLIDRTRTCYGMKSRNSQVRCLAVCSLLCTFWFLYQWLLILMLCPVCNECSVNKPRPAYEMKNVLISNKGCLTPKDRLDFDQDLREVKAKRKIEPQGTTKDLSPFKQIVLKNSDISSCVVFIKLDANECKVGVAKSLKKKTFNHRLVKYQSSQDLMREMLK